MKTGLRGVSFPAVKLWHFWALGAAWLMSWQSDLLDGLLQACLAPHVWSDQSKLKVRISSTSA